jgi:hypothetical protein
MPLVGNKGEWSELYVLIKVIADGKLFQSDFSLNKDPDNVYEIVTAYKDERNYRPDFRRADDITIYKVINSAAEHVATVSIDEFTTISKEILKGIKTGKGKTFPINPIGESLERDLLITKLKADSSTKADIKLRIYDHRLAKETDLGFSIKSLLGNDSTLFNTGLGNNFIYEVENKSNCDLTDFNKNTYKSPNKTSRLTYRLNELDRMGCRLKFKDIQSRKLWKNLKIVDGDLPEVMAWALYYRWFFREPSIKKVTELLEANDPMEFYGGETSGQKFYESKIKRFLIESAMGMTAETPWIGEYDSFGGVIIAKNDGDIVCFHVYDFNLFSNYLLNNTMFEQASTGEDEFNPGFPKSNGKKYYYGWLYEEQNKLYYKINLQVRFT